jgi:hypothetical protein
VTLPERCVPCDKGAAPLDLEAARALHAEVPEWTLDFPHLRRTFRCKDFRAALQWVNRVGMLAEKQTQFAVPPLVPSHRAITLSAASTMYWFLRCIFQALYPGSHTYTTSRAYLRSLW